MENPYKETLDIISDFIMWCEDDLIKQERKWIRGEITREEFLEMAVNLYSNLDCSISRAIANVNAKKE